MNILTACRKKYGERRGFTMAEVLLAVAILLILFALLVPNLVRTRRNLRQKELNAKAEILYHAAQNQLSKLRADGNSELYTKNGYPLSSPPTDRDTDQPNDAERVFYYLRAGDSSAGWLLPSGSADAGLLQHDWIIEYEPQKGTVYAVFYSESKNALDAYNSLATREALRYDGGGKVGYYGGEIVAEATTEGSSYYLTPHIDPNNGEKLTLTLSCRAENFDDDLTWKLTIKDINGNACTVVIPVPNSGLNRSCVVTLDDLSSSAKRFGNANKVYTSLGALNPVIGSKKPSDLTPGEVTLLLEVTSANARQVKGTYPEDPDHEQFTVNTLYADKKDAAGYPAADAYIACGRHLQNLDRSAFGGHTVTVETALQIDNLYLGKSESNWQKTYNGDDPESGYFNNNGKKGDPVFLPITNPSLKSYNGGNNMISGLLAGVNAGNSGLFGAFSGTKLENLTLTGTKVSAASATNAGALAGAVSGNCEITNCRVYLEEEPDRKTIRNAWDAEESEWISMIGGANAGGLVGASSGELTISNSFAATTINGTAAAGGLVGSAGGALTLARSYADCYIVSPRAGGLVGSGDGVKASSCYAAGFLSAPDGAATASAAGLVNGSSAVLGNCYTVCDLGDAADSHATVRDGTLNDYVRYLTAGKTTSRGDAIGTADAATLKAWVDPDNAFFDNQAAVTESYNLKKNGLSGMRYPYPELRGMTTHYGDWKAEFQSGGLVYYETYQLANGKTVSGFRGEGVNTLNDTYRLIGDGYGIAMKSTIAPTVKVDGAQCVLNSYIQVNDGSAVYYVYPLPESVVNAEPQPGQFWRSVTIQTSMSTPARSFWFNPLFADTQQEQLPSGYPTGNVAIRSPRHLYALSEYYVSKWSSLGCTFLQERGIDYADYHWDTYCCTKRPDSEYTAGGVLTYLQKPIGTEAIPFVAGYNGSCCKITGVSIRSASGATVGLFGTSGSMLQNIILSAPAGKGFYVSRTDVLNENQTAYMGVLAGHNKGEISNCAVAGYSLRGSTDTLYVYNDSTLYAGGLVGRNDGSIKYCSAVFPEINVSGTFSNIYLGGFVGRNGGVVRSCYAIGHLNADRREGTVAAAGFAGANNGSVADSYCAVSMITQNGAESDGFAPLGGQIVSDCCYLTDGAYYYRGRLYSYGVASKGAPDAGRNYEELRKLSMEAQVTAANSFDYDRNYTDASEGTAPAYPFRGVVRRGDGRGGPYVHYGDWQTRPKLGTLGVFYWEREEGGSNAGYHISFVGTDEGTNKQDSTLCTAHDDGGRITDYGYGYYVLNGQDTVAWQWSGNITEHADSEWEEAYKRNETLTPLQNARKELEEQLDGYTFYPWLSGYHNSSEGDDCLYINDLSTAGTLTLTFNGNSYVYTVSPFFAGAITRGDHAHRAGDSSAGNPAVNDPLMPGNSEQTEYQVRSVQQLQYINWYCNKEEGIYNCDTLVTGEMGDLAAGNRQHFPYLQYATVVGTGKQTKADATAARPAQYWLQTHDLDGTNFNGYTPVAGKATSSRSGYGPDGIDADRPAPLFAWFGGSYDGQSYKIQNLDIISDSYTVGLFGVTVGATIKNIILYGDGTGGKGVASTGTPAPVVRRVTDTGTVRDMVGAYQIGGLVALAYDYDTSDAAAVSTISNCAISGYVIDDSSRNQHGLGYAGVGGLIGVSQVKLERCSAVADIRINYRSPNKDSNTQVYSRYGNMIRVGGLTGTALYQISDCYTGGSIFINPDTLHEKPWGYTAPGYVATRANSLQIFVGGIAGSVYKYGIVNFTGGSLTSDGTVNINNCYTYLTLPAMEGNLYAASIIVGPGDRFHSGAFLNASNCYYLEDRVLKNYESFAYIPRNFTFKRGVTSSLTEAEVKGIVFGDLDCLPKVLFDNTANKNHSSPAKGQQTAVDYEQLSGLKEIDLRNDNGELNGTTVQLPGALGSGWSTVTKTENGSSVHGKYSFSDDPAQRGKNYPFPAVIQQGRDQSGDPIYVHYGAWPINGAHWALGRADMDIFADMKDDGYAETELTLKLTEAHGIDGERTVEENRYDPYDFRFNSAGIAQVVRLAPWVDPETGEANPQYLSVTIRALKPGAVTLSEEHTGASCILNVTAQLPLAAVPEQLQLPGDGQFTCTAVLGSKDYTFDDNGEWSAEAEKENNKPLFQVQPVDGEANRNSFTVSDSAPGDSFVLVTYSYEYCENRDNRDTPGGTDDRLKSTMIVPVRTLGYIGLSNTSSSAVCVNAASRGSDTEPQLTRELNAPQGADLFLFAPAGENDLKDFVITRIEVCDENGTVEEVYPNKSAQPRWTVSFFTTDGKANGPGTGYPEITQDAYYKYYGASVRYLGTEGAVKTVSVKITLDDPVVTLGEGDSKQPRSYELTVSDVTAYRYEATFYPGEIKGAGAAEKLMRPIGITDGTVLPLCSYTNKGYRFAGWLSNRTTTDGEGNPVYVTYEDGAVMNDVTSDVILTAQWTPITYNVRFVSNTPENKRVDAVFTYDLTRLPDPTAENDFEGLDFEVPSEQGASRFAGWNTRANGSGTEYAVGDMNLTELQGKQITLYAQWSNAYKLILAQKNDADVRQEFILRNGEEFTLTDYAAPTLDGWELDGWYTTDGSVQVLTGAGEPIPGAAGCTDEDGKLTLSDNLTLYSRWSRKAYVEVYKLDPDVDAEGVVKLDGSGRSSCDGEYLIASGNSGDVRLMANTDTANKTWTNIDSPTVSVHTGSFTDDAGHTYQNAVYIGEDTVSPLTGVRWTVRYWDNQVTRKYIHPRFMFFNEKDLSLRDHNGALICMTKKTNDDNGWKWKGDYNNRNLWVYGLMTRSDGTLRERQLISEWNALDPKTYNGLGWNGTSWATEADLCAYLYRLHDIYTFEP